MYQYSRQMIRGNFVLQVNAEGGYVSLHAPQTMGDDATLRKVALDLISSVAVTDVAWH